VSDAFLIGHFDVVLEVRLTQGVFLFSCSAPPEVDAIARDATSAPFAPIGKSRLHRSMPAAGSAACLDYRAT
jgi:hypothetical protein